MLTDLLNEEFDPEVRKRGEVYAATGHVRRLAVRPDYLTAEVHGSDIYEVTMDLESKPGRWDVFAQCTCPYAAGGLCKHMWATLVKAQHRIASTWGPPPRRVQLHFDETEFAAARDEGDDEHDYDARSPLRTALSSSGRAAKPPPARGGASKHPAKPKPPAWERLLDSAPPSYTSYERLPPNAPAGPLRYILDAERSRFNGVVTIALAQSAAGTTNTKRVAITPGSVPLLADAKDRAICAMLVGAARRGRESVYSFGDSTRSDVRSSLWQLERDLAPVIVPMLFDTGRFFWASGEKEAPRPLRPASEPWELAFVVERENPHRPGQDPVRHRGQESEEKRLLRAALVRGPDSVPLDRFDGVFEGRPGYALHDDTLSPLKSGVRHGLFQWLTRLQPIEISLADSLPLLRSLHERGLRIPVRWPPEWPVRERSDVAPRPRVTVRALDSGNAANGTLEAKISFLYEDDVAENDGGRYVEARGNSATAGATLIARRPDEEQKAAARLAELGVKPAPYQPGRATLAAKKLSGLVTTLIGEGWEVRGEAGLFRTASTIDIRVSTGIDWFEVKGKADFGGATASIAELLAALKRGDRFVTLSDGSQGMMPEQWLERHAGWMRLGEPDGDHIRFSRVQLSVIDAMLAELPEATCDEQFAQARRALAAFDGVQAATAPRAFRGKLRPYQRVGLGWLGFLDEFGFGGCLADDMGLGKTVQVLAFLARRATPETRAGAGPWLLVAPRSLVFNWLRETERFVPSLRVVDHTGADRNGACDSFAGVDLVLTTYGTMRSDIDRLRTIDFAGVVLDEAQAIKNPASQAAKAARLLRARRRLALTGTPVENSLEDLWSIFEFLNPGMLGSASTFASIARTTADGVESANLAMLRRALRPFILRRTKRVVAPELPERTEQTILCELVGRQRTLYDGLRQHYRDQLIGRIDREGMNKSRMHVLEALLRLRQAACHPNLIEPKAKRSPSAKIATLLDMLAQIAAEGNKALVFSQFTSLLDLAQHELGSRKIPYERLDGKTEARERERRVVRFQSDGACPIFLISLKAGGVGLNLTAAQYVFLLDPWWNPAVEAQAIDRTHRIGQDRRVSAYRLIAKGTVEERILELQASKRELADAIIGEQAGGLKALTREDLEWLLG